MARSPLTRNRSAMMPTTKGTQHIQKFAHSTPNNNIKIQSSGYGLPSKSRFQLRSCDKSLPTTSRGFEILLPPRTMTKIRKNSADYLNITILKDMFKRLIEPDFDLVLPKNLSKAAFGHYAGQDYTPIEDRLIVSLLLEINGKEKTVSELWKEIAKRYRMVMARRRTWQGLKNRYIRYIKPNLPEFHSLTYPRPLCSDSEGDSNFQKNKPAPKRRTRSKKN